ncbi:MAG: IS21 family transposase [Planctomycetota bacterium]|jgi:transposase
MKRVQDYDLVRRMFYRERLSRREISRRTGYHRTTISKMLRHPTPPEYRLSAPRIQKKLTPFIGIIDTILKDDKKHPKKQRHTALRIFERLRDEHGFTGKYTIVRDYVREKKIATKEVFFPLEQAAGTSQVDFGEALVVINGCEEKAYFFCMALPFSDAVYVQAYPTQAFEAVAAGHVAAYKFFGGVPHTNLYDNMSTVVKTVLKNSD